MIHKMILENNTHTHSKHIIEILEEQQIIVTVYGIYIQTNPTLRTV